MAECYDIEVDQGADHSFTINYADSNGTPIDLTDYSYRMDVRVGLKDSELLFTLTEGDGIDASGEATGTILVTINNMRTGLLQNLVYRYDLEITSPGGVVTRLIEGSVTAKPEVTD